MASRKGVWWWIAALTLLGAWFYLQGEWVACLISLTLWVIAVRGCFRSIPDGMDGVIVDIFGLPLLALSSGPVRARGFWERVILIPRGIYVLPYTVRVEIVGKNGRGGRPVSALIKLFVRFPDPGEPRYERVRLGRKGERVRARGPGSFFLCEMFRHFPRAYGGGGVGRLGRYLAKEVLPTLAGRFPSNYLAAAHTLQESMALAMGLRGVPWKCFGIFVVEWVEADTSDTPRVLFHEAEARFMPASTAGNSSKSVKVADGVTEEVADLLASNRRN